MDTGTWSWLARPDGTDREVFVPDTRIDTLRDGQTLHAVRGYGRTLIVMEGETCVGWSAVETVTGFRTVAAWLASKAVES